MTTTLCPVSLWPVSATSFSATTASAWRLRGGCVHVICPWASPSRTSGSAAWTWLTRCSTRTMR